MQTFITIAQVVVFILSPLAIRYLANRNKILQAMGPVVLAYLAGITFKNLNLVGINLIPGDPVVFKETAETTFALSIMAAIPLMLFSTDFKNWLKYARASATAFAVSCLCIMIVGAATTIFYARGIDEGWKVACMLVGSFTGGTPNFLSIGLALKTKEEITIVANTTELFASACYMLFILNFGKRWLGKFLPPFKFDENYEKLAASISNEPVRWNAALRGVVLTLFIVGASIGLGFGMQSVLKQIGVVPAVANELKLPIFVLFVTTFSLFASFIPEVRRLKNVDQVGDYAILIFAVSFGTLVDAGKLNLAYIEYFYLAFLILIGTITLYYTVCYFLKIDVDTAIIVSCACIFSPPFIPMFSENLNNKTTLVTGLTTGVAGYALGNYLGLLLAYLLHP